MNALRIKLLGGIGAAALGLVVACSGSDDEPGNNNDTDGGNSSGDNGSSGNGNGSSGNGNGSSSGGATPACQERSVGCYKSTLAKESGPDIPECQAPPAPYDVLYSRYEGPVESDGGASELPEGCEIVSQTDCSVKTKCTYDASDPGGARVIESEVTLDGDTITVTSSTTPEGGEACVTSITTEKTEDADCEGDGGN